MVERGQVLVRGQVFKAELVPGGPAARGNLWVRFARWVIMSSVVWPVAAADVGGALAGFFYWYGPTILAAPWYYWIFVPDCPLAALLMGAALLAFHFRRRWDFLGLLATGTCIKYGFWTALSWSVEFARGGPYTLEGVGMGVTHVILLIEGLMLTGFLRYRVLPVVVAALYLVANDVVDYVAGQYPRLPELVGVGLMMRVAVVTTALIVVFWAVMTWVAARRERVQAGALRGAPGGARGGAGGGAGGGALAKGEGSR